MQNSYPLESIDVLATISLNPNVVDLNDLSGEQCRNLDNFLREECIRIQSLIKSHVFGATKRKEIEIIIRKYYISTINIIDIVFANRSKLPDDHSDLVKVYESLFNVLSDILQFIENRYPEFLSQDERVASTYLLMSRQRLRQKLEEFKARLKLDQVIHQYPYKLLISRLERFIKKSDSDFEITFRTLFYKRELVKGLHEINLQKEGTTLDSTFREIDKLLIYLNYNSKSYIDDLTLRLYHQISTFENPQKKIERLYYFRKIFRQLHRKPGFILNPNYHNLDVVMENWFEEEISYWEKQITFAANGDIIDSIETKKDSSDTVQKILCSLSADQIALILRGADEARIFVANSITEVFRTVVPYLSTPHRKDLSYESMRTKSYVAEDRDKQLAIEALQKIAKRIESY
ncbi:hypothetical protein MUB18_20625 [Sphingobacterium sp. PCS056]|uniref:hypothetical protein n=1 Tax=Sphingobacterium sp. PCS056 TaxID=2931400 RepID=UPI00200EB815|nr:hypothetical protein [Sphingobacterium sp. PCS056]UPZ36494.1 hypothetical protein MUB18_20625 [Sphingobacterium sp. PCS056]